MNLAGVEIILNMRLKIERMQGELKFMDSQVQFATVTISLAEKDMETPAGFLLKERVQLSLFAPDVEKIYAEIKGYGSTCDAHHRVRLDETGEEPARAMSRALEEAGLPPDAVDYLAYHGTSTELNDRVETREKRHQAVADGQVEGERA